MDDLFSQAWPVLAVWLADQREQGARKWHERRLLRNYWHLWVQNAAIFPPPLVSSSDPDVGLARMMYANGLFHSSEGEESSELDPVEPALATSTDHAYFLPHATVVDRMVGADAQRLLEHNMHYRAMFFELLHAIASRTPFPDPVIPQYADSSAGSSEDAARVRETGFGMQRTRKTRRQRNLRARPHHMPDYEDAAKENPQNGIIDS